MPESGRSLPPRPSLQQQQKQAKELLRALRAGDPAVLTRVRLHLPDKARLTLADAQLVVAREHGFRSWAALKAYVEQSGADLAASALEAVHRAFASRDAATIRAAVLRHPEARARIDTPAFPFDSTALGHFAGAGDLAVVEVLLELGADPNRKSGWWAGGFHPLHVATGAVAERLMQAGAVPDACAAANLDRPDLLARILDADPARVHERGGDGQTPLHFARSREVADLLLARGADIDARDVDHRATPAQWMLDRARGAGRYDLARHLVSRGASADVFLGAALGLTDVLRGMLRADPSLLDRRTGQGEYGAHPPSSHHIYLWTIGPNRSPLQVAAQFGQDEALAVMRAFATPRQRFLAACAAARAGEARVLLREWPGLVAELTPDEQRALPDAAWASDPAAVALMLELGFDPATRGHDGGTALHCAAWQGSVAATRAVLGDPAGRALVEVRDASYAATPLGWCCHGAQHCGNPAADHPGVARLLLEAGAWPDRGWQDAPEPVRAVIRGFAAAPHD
jgi:ankyrin repeat protein